MIYQNTTTPDDNSFSTNKGDGAFQEPTREEERGESSEPDAPTAGEENAGMNTILDGDLGTGVQTDVDDE